MIKFIEKKNKTVKFQTLKVGDTFKSPNCSAYCMKFGYPVNAHGYTYNGINLNTGSLVRFSDADDVYAVNLMAEVEY
jgi:hypothetical protein